MPLQTTAPRLSAFLPARLGWSATVDSMIFLGAYLLVVPVSVATSRSAPNKTTPPTVAVQPSRGGRRAFNRVSFVWCGMGLLPWVKGTCPSFVWVVVLILHARAVNTHPRADGTRRT